MNLKTRFSDENLFYWYILCLAKAENGVYLQLKPNAFILVLEMLLSP